MPPSTAARMAAATHVLTTVTCLSRCFAPRQASLSRPFGTRDFLASNPALKRWAILSCLFGTTKPPPFDAKPLSAETRNSMARRIAFPDPVNVFLVPSPQNTLT